MEQVAATLKEVGVPFEMTAISPYRTPDAVREYAQGAESKGFEVIVAGSGGTNELACMVSSYTCLPVIGLPLRSSGEHSATAEFAALLSTLETAPGVPVATVGFNDAENAATLAVQILGTKDRRVRRLIEKRRSEAVKKATEARSRVEARSQELQGS